MMPVVEPGSHHVADGTTGNHVTEEMPLCTDSGCADQDGECVDAITDEPIVAVLPRDDGGSSPCAHRMAGRERLLTMPESSSAGVVEIGSFASRGVLQHLRNGLRMSNCLRDDETGLNSPAIAGDCADAN